MGIRGAAIVAAALFLLPVGAAQPAAQQRPLAFAPLMGSHAARIHGAGLNSPGGGTPPLLWNGGPVMQSATVYAIFWAPSDYADAFPTGYSSTIGQYLTDVAAESGTDTNVFSIDTEYPGSNGPLAYDFSLGGSWTDTQSFPTGDCTGNDGTGFTNLCLTDSQLQTEIQHAITTNGWAPGLTTMFLLFTPPNVGSCADNLGAGCAYAPNGYCGYHNDFASGGSNAIYANLPYLGGIDGCDAGQYPNANTADATINVLSHELNEAITDPLLSAWWDSSGYEIGDECNGYFGTSPSGASGSEYTQTINGHHYFTQLEWSNLGNACLPQEPTTPVVTNFTPSRGPVGTTITISGSGFTDFTAVRVGGTAATNVSLVDDGTLHATVASGTPSGHVSVTTAAGTGASVGNFTVTQALTVSKAGAGSGTVGSSPDGISCGDTCSFPFDSGASVTLTATPATGSSFAGWSGGGCSGTGTCNVTMTADTAVTATFSLVPETLSTATSGTGSGTVTSSPAGISCGSSCATAFDYGTSVTLTATPATGSSFAGWSGGGCSGTGTCTVSMTGAESVTATFSLVRETLSTSTSGTGSGTITSSPAGISCGSTCSSAFDYGTSVSLTATAANGSVFAGWSGACTGTGACTVPMTSAQSVGAVFTKQLVCVVPNVKGQTLAAARAAIVGAHCSVGTVSSATSKKVKKGRVVSQSPGPAKQLADGAKVNLVVSKGKRH